MDVPLDKMTVAEKIELLEAVWADLARNPENVSSPEWHRDVLKEREASAQSGNYMKWDEAKRWIREQLDGR